MAVKGAQVKWHGERYTREVRELMKERLVHVGHAVADRVRENIGINGPPRSSPGEFPRVDQEELVKSIYIKDDLRELKIEVRSSSDHALPLEFGTKTMAPRPFMRRTLLEMRSEIRAMMLRAAPGTTGRFQFTS